jgi:predicted ATPase
MQVSSQDAHRFFLSYRREETAGHAGRLADHLLDRFGAGSVFMDVESIEAGADFTEAIGRAIADSDAVLVLIGPGWLGSAGSDRRRRLDNASDFVRREVEAALSSDVRVIPVLVGGASMPAEEHLPPSIGELARRNAVELQDRRWREDVDALIDVLEGRGRAGVGNLPMEPTPFLGRAHELSEVLELLRRQDVRLLTLTGPGGIGKTRLAVQAASKLAHIYAGGAWFVGLAALTDAELMLAEAASVLEVRDGTGGSIVDAISKRISPRRTLIVLDNLEQLLPEVAAPIAELSAAAPSLQLIAASREPLHLAAEREFPVTTLSDDEATALFVARARASRPDFELRDDAERETTRTICARLDRLPLAIELAAARIKLFSPVELLERLEQRLPLLTGGARDAPERQRTLRATIAWSYDLLNEDEHELFERLAVFAGGFTLEAAESVCDAGLETVQALLERNLVRDRAEDARTKRYEMLETIREFALERFEERTDAEAFRRRHADYFLAIAEAADSELKGPDQATWIERLDMEHDNHRAALRWALDGADPELGLRLVVELNHVWVQRRPVSEIRMWLVQALERTSPVATEVRARALQQAGFLAAEQGEEAIALLEEAIRCAHEVGSMAVEAKAMSGLSFFRSPEEMVPLGQEAVTLARGSGDRWMLAITLNNLGEAYREAGDNAAATGAYEEGYQLLRAMGDRSRSAFVLGNLAEMAILADDLPRARTLSSEALEVAEAMGNQRQVSSAQAALGWIALAEGTLDEAREHFDVSLALSRDLGANQLSVDAIYGLAGIAAAEGDVIRAARLEAVASRFEQILGHQPTAADSGIHARYLEELRDTTDPRVWEEAAHGGEGMSLDEAIAYALSPIA